MKNSGIENIENLAHNMKDTIDDLKSSRMTEMKNSIINHNLLDGNLLTDKKKIFFTEGKDFKKILRTMEQEM